MADQQQADPDVRAALSAADRFLAAQAAQANADLEAARIRAETAQRRLAAFRQGGRLSRTEALLVGMTAITDTAGIGRDVVAGRPGVTAEAFLSVQQTTDAVHRGLLALGHDIPKQAEQPKAEQ
jgi:inosine/xanthosine triphosphate pyrophosphatase family protein